MSAPNLTLLSRIGQTGSRGLRVYTPDPRALECSCELSDATSTRMFRSSVADLDQLLDFNLVEREEVSPTRQTYRLTDAGKAALAKGAA